MTPRRARPVSASRLPLCAAAACSLATTGETLAHTGARGHVLLLPTGLFQLGGAAVVAATLVVMLWVKPRTLTRPLSLYTELFAVGFHPRATQWAASGVVVALLVAGLVGSRDPLANPLPLTVWTLVWIGLTGLHAVFGNLWPALDPWRAPARWLRRNLLGRKARLEYPQALGAWPAVALLAGFAWFELVYPAPQDPGVLACVVGLYSVLCITGSALFGERAWSRNVELFSSYFRMVSWVAPFRLERCRSAGFRARFGFPGRALLAVGALPAPAVVFVIVALATVSFDGLSRTFWWLDLVGENPLEHPGRTALVSVNTLGLLLAAGVLLGAYTLGVALGARLAALTAQRNAHLRLLVVSIVPIAFGYHFAHYLPVLLLDGQFALRAWLDPFHAGWDPLGIVSSPVSASLLTHHRSVELIWYTQVTVIVVAHVAAVVAGHALLGRLTDSRTKAVAAALPLGALMVAYTLFGLWLLSAPVAA